MVQITRATVLYSVNRVLCSAHLFKYPRLAALFILRIGFESLASLLDSTTDCWSVVFRM